MEIIAIIFLILIIMVLVLTIGALTLLIYEVIPEDLKDAYRNWKNKKK